MSTVSAGYGEAGFPPTAQPLADPAEGQEVLKMLIYYLLRVEPSASCKGWVCMLQI